MISTITRPVIALIATPRIISRDRLDTLDGPAIFVANHSSHLDTSVLLSSLPRRFQRRMAVAARHDYFFDKHWKAALWAVWMNIIPIERGKASRRSIHLALSVIADGWSLALYPEETRGDDDFTVPFKPGAAYLAIRAGVPVVPVHLEGTRWIFTPYTRRFRPGSTRVVFGTPLYPQPDERAQNFNVRVEEAVNIAADEGRTDWWSARRRAADKTTPSLRGPGELSGWRKAWAATASAPSGNQATRRWPR